MRVEDDSIIGENFFPRKEFKYEERISENYIERTFKRPDGTIRIHCDPIKEVAYCTWEESEKITTSCSQTYDSNRLELNCPNCGNLILWKREKDER